MVEVASEELWEVRLLFGGFVRSFGGGDGL